MGLNGNSLEDFQTFQNAMNDLNPGWQELYQAALLELDRDRLLLRIEVAEEAIHARVKAINRFGSDREEAQALEDALHALSLLRRSAATE